EAHPLQVPSPFLLCFQRFKERLEVAFSKAAAAAALDDLDKRCRPVLDWSGENLQQVAFVIPVNQDAQLLDRLERFPDLSDSIAQGFIILAGHAQKLDAAFFEGLHGLDDVAGGHG